MRRQSLACLAAAILSGCLARPSPKDKSVETKFPTTPTTGTGSLPRQLRVVTFNVHREAGNKVIEGIKGDRDLRDADLIILQEVHRKEPAAQPCSAACSLGEDLGFYSLYAPGHVQGDGTDGVAIVSRAPILSSQVLELPAFDIGFNNSRRVALIATVLIDGQPVTVYAVHLTNRLTIGERTQQMRPVLEHAQQQTTPVIIAGDMNTVPFTFVGNVVPIPNRNQDNRLEELVRAYGFDTPCAGSGHTFRRMKMKLDAIYTRGFKTHRFATAQANGVSDHLALWAVLEPIFSRS
jgi:endonuclease/exonuclease/phosphatase family metal-dependent hydrolase